MHGRADQSRPTQSKIEKSKAEQSRAEQSRARQKRAAQSRADQSRAEKSRADQSRAEQFRAEQRDHKAEQSRAQQSRAEQSRAKQSRTTTSYNISLFIHISGRANRLLAACVYPSACDMCWNSRTSEGLGIKQTVDASSLEEHDKAELVKLLSEAGKNLDELIANGLSQFQHEAIGCRPRPGHGDTVSRLVRKRNAHINRRRVQNVLPPTRG